MKAWMMLVGTVGVIVVRVLLVWGYLAVNGSDPIILNPDRRLDEKGPTMMMVCGSGFDVAKIGPEDTPDADCERVL